MNRHTPCYTTQDSNTHSVTFKTADPWTNYRAERHLYLTLKYFFDLKVSLVSFQTKWSSNFTWIFWKKLKENKNEGLLKSAPVVWIFSLFLILSTLTIIIQQTFFRHISAVYRCCFHSRVLTENMFLLYRLFVHLKEIFHIFHIFETVSSLNNQNINLYK